MLVFGLVLAFGGPRLPVGQGFYLAVVLAALATGPLGGAGAGCVAVALFEAALLAKGSLAWRGVVSDPDAVRLASYLAVGTAVGFVSQRGRRLLNDSLHHLDALLTLAGRDLTTAALDGRGLRRALDRRLAGAAPFSMLVFELAAGDAFADDELRALAALVGRELGVGEELARLGPARFAVIAGAQSEDEARRTVAPLEASLRKAGYDPAFGWAVSSDAGEDGLLLFAAALERLYARLIELGRWQRREGVPELASTAAA